MKTLITAAALTLCLSTVASAEEAFPYEVVYAGQCTPDDPHFDLEILYDAGRHAAGLKIAKARFADNPDDADLTWHIARFIFEMGESVDRNDRTVDKVALYSSMLDYANRGLEIRPNDPHIHFARGIAAGRLGTTRGVIASLWSAKGIERDWLYTSNSGFEYASIGGDELLPCDADLALGMFYRLVPDSFIVQLLAGTRGSLEKSLDHLERANVCAPGRIGTMKELGVTQLCLGTKGKDPGMMARGKATVSAYMARAPQSELDRIDIAHGRKLLADPAMACGYSRDGQQDLDTKDL